MLVDTHSHLYLEHFRDDIDDVVRRCRERGVAKVVLPNIDMQSVDDLSTVCRDYPELFLPALGLHPCSVKAGWEEELTDIRRLIDGGLIDFPDHRIYGIGEIGLDYYWDLTFKEEQQQALRRQAAWAKELALPVILHCRDSFHDLISIMEELNDDNLTGIFHCFTGTLAEAERIMDLGGFMVGLGGVLTFKKSAELREVASQLPLEYIILETDAPYLSPAPFRGKRNESSYVHHVALTLAESRGQSYEEIAAATTANAARMFGMDMLPGSGGL
jgi:TatD DNase family protein